MRVACLLDSGFEDSEYQVPAERFRGAGHEVVVVGLERGKEVTGKRGNVTVTTDLGVDSARPEDFEALFLPGGYSPDHLRADDRAVAFTRAFFEQPRPVLAICHGPQLLISAGVVGRRRMTAWTTIQTDLRYAGADVVDSEVVVDGELVTSRKPDDIDAFVSGSLAVLGRVPASR